MGVGRRAEWEVRNMTDGEEIVEEEIEFRIIDDRMYSKDHMWFQKLESKDEDTRDLYKIGASDFLPAEMGEMIRVVLAQPENVDDYDELDGVEDGDQNGTGARDADFVGHEVLKGEPLATLRASAFTHVIYAPVACHVVELNGEVEDSPELLNEDPYGDGWLMNIKPDGLDEDELLTPEEYLDFLYEV